MRKREGVEVRTKQSQWTRMIRTHRWLQVHQAQLKGTVFGCLSWPSPSFCPSLPRRPCTLSALRQASRVCRCNRICLPGESHIFSTCHPTQISSINKQDCKGVLWLTGELRLPLAQALLLCCREVWKIIVCFFQGLLLQTERSQAPGSIFPCEDSIRAIWKYTALELIGSGHHVYSRNNQNWLLYCCQDNSCLCRSHKPTQGQSTLSRTGSIWHFT